ncbi:hypothetical protein [Porphyromonas loveana]|uniref:hypothetical protein n=1 Tax=Porphyromonas loveana TaxID=1884669 RepID=UPI0035A031EC
MKKTIVIGLATILFPLMAEAVSPALISPDTTIRTQDKTIVIEETDDDIDITLYRHRMDGDSVRSQQVFKGIYLKGRSIEQRFRNTIFDVPLNFSRSKDRKGDRRTRDVGLGSFKLGFVNLTGDAGDHINASSSLRYTIGLMSVSCRLNDWLVIAPNMDIEFNSIHLKGNYSFRDVNGVTQVLPADAGVTYDKSRLHITYMDFALPLILRKYRSNISFYVAPALKFKTASSSKVWLPDHKKYEKHGGDLNLNPVVVEARIGVNYRGFNLYGSYTLTPIFRGDKGPDTRMFAIGFGYGL